MITLRRAEQRHDARRGEQGVWQTFWAPTDDDPQPSGFGRLERLNEVRLPPSSTVSARPHGDTETITYVREGALAYGDSLGRSGVVQAGEFRRMTARRGTHFSETNASRVDWAHLFQIGLRSSGGAPAAEEQKRFSSGDRRNVMCLVASADGRGSSLRIREDVLVYSALLKAGQHVVHDLHLGRRAWLHVVSGQVTFDDLVLSRGDGVGVTTERSVSFTAGHDAEVLLIDVALV